MTGQDREIADLRLRVGAAMGLDDPDDNVDALALGVPGSREHFPGFAHPGGGAKEHLQPAPPLAGSGGDQGVGVGPGVPVVGHRRIIPGYKPRLSPHQRMADGVQQHILTAATRGSMIARARRARVRALTSPSTNRSRS
jgi:hypothetical protein